MTDGRSLSSTGAVRGFVAVGVTFRRRWQLGCPRPLWRGGIVPANGAFDVLRPGAER